jgi:hypothetical protein
VLGALAIVIAVAEEADEPSKTPFYVVGGLLAVFAVVISAIGIPRHATFPPSRGAARAVMALAVVLVVATMATAVLTS